MKWTGREPPFGPPLGDRAIKRRKRFRHSDVEMLQTVGNRPTTGAGVPVELCFCKIGGDRPAVCFDRLELLDHVPKFEGHLVILGDHPVCRVVAITSRAYVFLSSPHAATHSRATVAALVLLLLPVARARVSYTLVVHTTNRSRTSAAIRCPDLSEKITLWDDRQPVLPIDQTPDSPVRRSFTKRILQRTIAGLRRGAATDLRGVGVAPPERSSDLEVLEYIRKYPNAIVTSAPSPDGLRRQPVPSRPKAAGCVSAGARRRLAPNRCF